AFTANDVRLLTSLANYAGLAISNAQLHGRVKDLSVTDELTGLANRRHLLERAERELLRAGRYGHPLACLLVDIDEFKPFHDAHGHLRGDEVLRHVAEVLRRELRAADLAARYGGDEFVVLLPEVGKADALVVAEKLRAAIASGGLEQSVTASVGVAAYPEDAERLDPLLEAADHALFGAKRSGRNQVTPFFRQQADGAQVEC